MKAKKPFLGFNFPLCFYINYFIEKKRENVFPFLSNNQGRNDIMQLPRGMTVYMSSFSRISVFLIRAQQKRTAKYRNHAKQESIFKLNVFTF